MQPTPVPHQKRPLSMADENGYPSKRQRQFYHRHHTFQFKQLGLPGTEPTLVGQTPNIDQPEAAVRPPGPKLVGRSQVDDFLDYSVVAICEAVASRDGIMKSSIDTWALEMFRGCVEEYVLNLCKYIRRSMLVARRTAPIATDFESAFQAAQVPAPDDQLPPQLTSKPPPSLSLLPTPPPDDFFHVPELPKSTTPSQSTTEEDNRRAQHIPSTFPGFPSQHTFRNTAVFPLRERDPRRIRDLATEEGRLGEQALRKLAGAVKGEGKLSLPREEAAAAAAAADARRCGRRKKVETIESMFEETMTELAKTEKATGLADGAEGEGFEVAPIVNSERKFWMPDISRRQTARVGPSNPSAKAGGHHHALSDKALGKQRVKDTKDLPEGYDLERMGSP